MLARALRRTLQAGALLVVTATGLDVWTRERERKAMQLPDAFVIEIDLENNQVGCGFQSAKVCCCHPPVPSIDIGLTP